MAKSGFERVKHVSLDEDNPFSNLVDCHNRIIKESIVKDGCERMKPVHLSKDQPSANLVDSRYRITNKKTVLNNKNHITRRLLNAATSEMGVTRN